MLRKFVHQPASTKLNFIPQQRYDRSDRRNVEDIEVVILHLELPPCHLPNVPFPHQI